MVEGENGGADTYSSIALSNDAARLAFQTNVPLGSGSIAGRAEAYVWTRADGTYRRISRTGDGAALGRVSGDVPITPNGRHVAFFTAQDPTIPGSVAAIHVVDLESGERDAIVGAAGVPLDAFFGIGIDLSADGRFVALATSNALSPKDINGRRDIYVFDRVTRSFELASVSSAGALSTCDSRSPSLSGDGRSVAYVSCGLLGFAHPEAGTIHAAFLRDRASGSTTLLSRPRNGGANPSYRDHDPVPTVSGDGSHVAFASPSERLVEGDTNRRIDAFVAELPAGTLRRVGLATGVALPAGPSSVDVEQPIVQEIHASRGGEQVLFSTVADNLLLSRSPSAMRVDTRSLAIRDALPLLFAGPPGATEIAQGLSDDGSIALVRRGVPNFDWAIPPGLATPLDLWLVGDAIGAVQVDTDPMLGTPHGTESARLSADGRRVAFLSRVLDPPSPRGVYRFDVATGSTARIDLPASGAPPTVGALDALALSRNGRWLVFASAADGLVAGDDDGSLDVFLADLDAGGLQRVLQPATGAPVIGPDAFGLAVAVSDDGERIAFTSDRVDLAPGEPRWTRLYLLDLGPGHLTRLSRPDAESTGTPTTPSISADGQRVAFIEGEVLRVVELGPDADIVGEPTAAFAPIRARRATISPDGYAVALLSAADFTGVPGWLAGDGVTPLLLRLPEPPAFADGFEPLAKAR